MTSDSGDGGDPTRASGMQNTIRANEDMERRREFKTDVIQIMVGHGFLQTGFQLVNAIINNRAGVTNSFV